MLTVFGLVFLYVLLMPGIGYAIATFLLLFAFQTIFTAQARPPVPAALGGRPELPADRRALLRVRPDLPDPSALSAERRRDAR